MSGLSTYMVLTDTACTSDRGSARLFRDL